MIHLLHILAKAAENAPQAIRTFNQVRGVVGHVRSAFGGSSAGNLSGRAGFLKCVEFLAATSETVKALDGRSLPFYVRHEGRLHEGLLECPHGGAGKLTVLSSFAYPPHRLPETFRRALGSLNDRSEDCLFDEFHCSYESRFGAEWQLRAEDLNPATLRTALGIVLGRTAAFDDQLVREGCVR